jgi:hypothetical protein
MKIFDLLSSLFLNLPELPDLLNIKVALRDFEDQSGLTSCCYANLDQVRLAESAATGRA